MLISELCDRAGIKYSTALVVALGCKKLKLLLAVFHRCQPQPVQLKPIGAGFPNLPYRCPKCAALVGNENELTYDVLIK